VRHQRVRSALLRQHGERTPGEEVNEMSDECGAKPALQDERGQAIVVIAFALVALVLFAGLALDAATIYAGQSRLKRAVDSAALAGVVELPSEATAAARTRQFMLGNGFDIANPESIPLFETARVPSTEYMQWAVTVTHRVPLLFLPMINFSHADVTEVAVAEYRSMVDVYTSQTGGRGIVGPTNLSNWGRWANPRWGDAYTPQCWTCNSGCDAFGAGKNFCPEPSGPNPDHSELYNEFAQGYPLRIYIPPAYAYDEVQIEILDPDGHNAPVNSDVTITYIDGSTDVVLLGDVDCHPYAGTANDNDRRDACLLETGDDPNLHWFLRMDENRSFSHLNNGRPSSYTPEYNTETEYRLFYHKQLADQSVLKETIGSTLVGGANDSTTDMSWVVAWTVDIDCDDGSCDIQHITPNEDGSLSLYLEVDGVSGYSQNGFDIWAGPPPTTYTVPADVNDRNIFLFQNPWAHDSGGVVTFASGYFPLTTNVTGPITVTFAYVPPEAIGLGVNLYHFDNDAAALGEPIDYYLEGVEDWHIQGTLSLNGTWSTTENYVYQPPGNRDHDNAPVPDEFYGGYLSAQYSARFLDTSSWRLEYEGIVGDVFVRLIQ
jgi:Flp pilus assembly protein TadG